MQKLNIAGIHMNIFSRDQYMLNRFKPFTYDFEGEADLVVSMNSCDHIQMPKADLLLSADNVEWLSSPGKDSPIVCITGRKTGEPICLLSSDNKWGRADITYLKDCPGIDYAVTGIMFNIIIRSRVLFHQGIVIHASAIEHNGKGIIFSAPSGTGKSTQASLWEKYMGARVLNDDCPVIRIDDGHPNVYGTPCSGSTESS
jgi:hypothetical protein